MSFFTECNHCSLRTLERFARSRGKLVTVAPGRDPGSFDALVHDPGETPDSDKHVVATFLALTDYCCC